MDNHQNQPASVPDRGKRRGARDWKPIRRAPISPAMSHAKIGVILGISKVRVIQIEADALRKLRFRLAAIAEEIA
jgi:hypothetical protein